MDHKLGWDHHDFIDTPVWKIPVFNKLYEFCLNTEETVQTMPFVSRHVTKSRHCVLNKLSVRHLVSKFPIFYRFRRFITASARISQWNLRWASCIHSTPYFSKVNHNIILSWTPRSLQVFRLNFVFRIFPTRATCLFPIILLESVTLIFLIVMLQTSMNPPYRV